MAEVLTSTITGLFLVVVTVLQHRLGKTVTRIKHELANEHPTNLRDDLDDKHLEASAQTTEVLAAIAHVDKRLDPVVADVGGIKADIRRLNERSTIHDDRINDLTQPRAEVRRIIEGTTHDRDTETR